MSLSSSQSLVESDAIQAEFPVPGQIVRVRSRTYAVEGVDPSAAGTIVSLACLDDDAQGQRLEAIWEIEYDAQIVGPDSWERIEQKGFDQPDYFAAYLHALRWNCVTATDASLFQAPFRAGIQVDAYQLEPLRKALRLPRVNMFIADDVGLGKTIESGLIASELILRRRVQEMVVAAPPSMLLQWKEELEDRFGLTFEILDRAYIDRVRQERGFGVNPWTTFPRFLISYHLLTDETYASPLRDWMGDRRPRSLLIFDEAHHAAPASGSKYAIDSRITRAIRDLAPRFEHRLFLSATPHNGHSNSFSALLELLDPQRFTRGVPVSRKNLDEVMVRRLKEDVRELQGGFPKRVVEQIDLEGLPDDQPELALSKLLDQYREVRLRRVAGESKRKQAEASLVITGLQQRLLSSVEAFARTLGVHRRSMERVWAGDAAFHRVAFGEIFGGVGSDDPMASLEPEELAAIEDDAFSRATAIGGALQADGGEERRLLDLMGQIATRSRNLPDARVQHLVRWIRQNMLDGNAWNSTRLLVFTEYEATLTYLSRALREALYDADRVDERIVLFRGSTSSDHRAAIKTAFNGNPDEYGIRILLATDAAREGLNLQARCSNLFHFDVPWNPARLEQRNGRIDRKLQPEPHVHCKYFVYTQRPEDRVLRALVAKTETIRRELGSLADVLEGRLAGALKGGIRHSEAGHIAQEIDAASLAPAFLDTYADELEGVRQRRAELQKSIDDLRRGINRSRNWIALQDGQLKQAMTLSLDLLGGGRLASGGSFGEARLDTYRLDGLSSRYGSDPSWASTLDTLRKPPVDGKRDARWRQSSPLRSVVFEAPSELSDDVVQLHLEHRLVKRLVGRFLAQGFIEHDLSRACLTQTKDAIPRVVLLGRLSLYGEGAARLHEEIVTVTARWSDPTQRKGPLTPYGREAEEKTLGLLEAALSGSRGGSIGDVQRRRLLQAAVSDIEELMRHLLLRGEASKTEAEKKLRERGLQEGQAMVEILQNQRARVLGKLQSTKPEQFVLAFDESEQRQLQADRRYWERWLVNVEEDLKTEPRRILDFYTVKTHRIEPIGLAYLWPETN